MKKKPVVSPYNVNDLTKRNHRALKLFLAGKSIGECASAIKVDEKTMQEMVNRYVSKSPSYQSRKEWSPWHMPDHTLRFHVTMYFVRMNLRLVEMRTLVDFNRSLAI